ncbi:MULTISPECIES: MerR family transcriptional regulator [Propionibacteriaceae]|uniref:MerR family transcriptional regulator n=1 Tax=Propionibacteriaceae TaxID=31957 RepID=UPI001A96A4F3|nr:MerR family transcriptional regulator [Tessaracoccus sp. SD287]MBO1030786.1 MerR family transcriptional regulator [Tessaracoccus sp. SD287]
MAEAPHSIGDVSRLTGLGIATLRAWETRYEVVSPHRSGNGIRRYDDDQVARLTRMRELVEAGIPPRRAAAMVDSSRQNENVSPLHDHEALLRARTERGQVESLLSETFALASLETVIDQWLMPSLHRVGEAWSTGQIDVAEEHLISAAVMHRLAATFTAGRASGPRVVVGLPAGSRHELPALALAVCLRRQNVDVVYLGADVPATSWPVVLHRFRPPAAVVGVTTRADVGAAQAAVRSCVGAGTPHVFVGGRAAGEVSGAVVLPGTLSGAAAVVAAAVGAGRR